MLQSQESANSNIIARQIKARKECLENVSIQPFRSHRKRKEEGDVLMPLQAIDDNKPEESQKTKLNRKYPPLSNFNTNQTKHIEGYKYKISQLTRSIATEEIPPKQPTAKGTESQAQTNRFSSIKRNSLLENPFTVNNQIQRNQVKSIIFDSKVEPFLSRYSNPSVEGIQQQNDMEINSFKEKVGKVDNQIQAGINNLEKMIEKLKQKKIKQSSLKSKTIQVRFQSETNPISEPIKIETKPEAKQQPPVEKEIAFDFTLKKDIKRQLRPQLEPSRSQMQLTGEFKSKLGKFPPQYTTFINRLAHQIHIDMEFTNMISEVSRSNQLPKIRNLIIKELKNQQQVELDESFLVIEPSQMDPLEVSKPYFIVTRPKEQEEAQLVSKICQKYYQIEAHFSSKLHKKSDNSIIKLLFQQLAKFNSAKRTQQAKSVTIGHHLLSYLNMRTNKSFRNRFFVKLAKRLQLKPASTLTLESFANLTV